MNFGQLVNSGIFIENDTKYEQKNLSWNKNKNKNMNEFFLTNEPTQYKMKSNKHKGQATLSK